MDTLLVKIFATALTFSQVATTPDTVKTQFDPIQDRQQVVSLLRAGCAQVRKAFDIEDLNIDDLIATAMDDAEAIAAGHAAFNGINIGDLHVAYRQFCKNETVAKVPVDIGEVIEFYNRTLADLPDHSRPQGQAAAWRQRGARPQGRGASPKSMSRTSGGSGWNSPIFRATCSRRSSPPRTSASTSTRGSTSAR